jgi:hypothetical protein
VCCGDKSMQACTGRRNGGQFGHIGGGAACYPHSDKNAISDPFRTTRSRGSGLASGVVMRRRPHRLCGEPPNCWEKLASHHQDRLHMTSPILWSRVALESAVRVSCRQTR